MQSVCLRVCVCVWERERGGGGERERENVCVCVWERETVCACAGVCVGVSVCVACSRCPGVFSLMLASDSDAADDAFTSCPCMPSKTRTSNRGLGLDMVTPLILSLEWQFLTENEDLGSQTKTFTTIFSPKVWKQYVEYLLFYFLRLWFILHCVPTCARYNSGTISFSHSVAQ